MKKFLKYFSAILCLLLFTSSCGYRFSGSGSVLPPEVKTVAIPVLENNTTQTGLELILTEAIRARFERHGAVKVVRNVDVADAVFYGRILGVETRVRDVTSSTDIALNLDLIMRVSAELVQNTGAVLWRDTNLSVADSFESVSDVVVTSSSSFAQSGINSSTLGALNELEVSRGQAAEAYEDMATEMARQIYNNAVAADF